MQAVPGQSNWSAFHLFSAALFICFQLINDPNQPGANLFREKILKAVTRLEQSRDIAVADKAFKILDALSPLYSPDFPTESMEEREAKKARVLSLVRTLAFPYHDSPKYPRSSTDSLSIRGSLNSPTESVPSTSPPGFGSNPQVLPPVSSVRNTISSQQQLLPFPTYSHLLPSRSNSQDQNMPPSLLNTYTNIQQHPAYNQPQQPQEFIRGAYVNPEDEGMMWGASVGFGPGEWTSFLDAIQRHGGGPQ